jgi:hypothetical protein
MGDPAENRYLAGLARKGRGEEVRARGLFEEALALDHGHRRSRWELSGFTAQD